MSIFRKPPLWAVSSASRWGMVALPQRCTISVLALEPEDELDMMNRFLYVRTITELAPRPCTSWAAKHENDTTA